MQTGSQLLHVKNCPMGQMTKRRWRRGAESPEPSRLNLCCRPRKASDLDSPTFTPDSTSPVVKSRHNQALVTRVSVFLEIMSQISKDQTLDITFLSDIFSQNKCISILSIQSEESGPKEITQNNYQTTGL